MPKKKYEHMGADDFENVIKRYCSRILRTDADLSAVEIETTIRKATNYPDRKDMLVEVTQMESSMWRGLGLTFSTEIRVVLLDYEDRILMFNSFGPNNLG